MNAEYAEYKENHKIILLISDNQIDIAKIRRLFMDTGGMVCRLYNCTTTVAALEQLEKKKLEVDIIILDIRIQDNTEFEPIFKVAASESHNIPIIILTGDNEEERAMATPFVTGGIASHIHREQFNSLTKLIGSLLFPEHKE